MAYGNRIKDTIATGGGGTGTITLNGTPAATYRAISNIGATGTTFDYCMEDGTNWEIGVGTTGATANTFTRAVIISSNSNTAVNFAAGANFFITANAESLAALITASSTTTLTNKRVTARVYTLSVPGASPSINTDSYDRVTMTGINATVAMTTNLTGTPVDGDTLILTFTDDGTSRSITWGSKFEAGVLTLPVATVAGVKMTCAFDWNATTSKWRLMGVA